jgi:hypothetical protein
MTSPGMAAVSTDAMSWVAWAASETQPMVGSLKWPPCASRSVNRRAEAVGAFLHDLTRRCKARSVGRRRLVSRARDLRRLDEVKGDSPASVGADSVRVTSADRPTLGKPSASVAAGARPGQSPGPQTRAREHDMLHLRGDREAGGHCPSCDPSIVWSRSPSAGAVPELAASTSPAPAEIAVASVSYCFFPTNTAPDQFRHRCELISGA